MALSPRSATRSRRPLYAPLALGLIAWLPACAPRETPPDQPAALQPEPVSLEGWQAETFPLPPDFAAELPAGTESLRFSPGWRDPAAEGFWSYAFVMWIDEPAPDAVRIKEILERYYNGLMSAFASGKGKDVSATPARVDVVRTGWGGWGSGRYEAKMHLVDAFATFEPIDLRVLVDSVGESDARSTLRIRVSPTQREHAIWRSLDAAIGEILAAGAGARETR